MQEQKHFEDTYFKTHVKNRPPEAPPPKKTKQFGGVKSDQGASGIEKIQKQVNEDKCNYSRLLSYEMNDVDFIQDFMKQANDLAESDLMKIPDTANGNNSKSVSQRASRVRMSTQSQNQK
jgi:hypothetical protein